MMPFSKLSFESVFSVYKNDFSYKIYNSQEIVYAEKFIYIL